METQVTTRSEPQASYKVSKRLLMLTVAGGAAFWMIDFVILVIGYLFNKQKGKI
jgi:hypothetical protein